MSILLTKHLRNELRRQMHQSQLDKSFGETLSKMNAGMVVRVVQEVIYHEMAHHPSASLVSSLALREALQHPELAEKHLIQIGQIHATWMVALRDTPRESAVDGMVHSYLVLPHEHAMSATVAGTFTRLIDSHNLAIALGGWLRALLSSSTCPPEVQARVLLLQGTAQGGLTWNAVTNKWGEPGSEWETEHFCRSVSTRWPEIVGLPFELQLELAASQPIPAEWFQNAWVFPEELDLRGGYAGGTDDLSKAEMMLDEILG